MIMSYSEPAQANNAFVINNLNGTKIATSNNNNNEMNNFNKPNIILPTSVTPEIGRNHTIPRLTTILWKDEITVCYQVIANGVVVLRRADNHMVNGTKLLNVTGMTRGRRDRMLRSEKERHVVKVGLMHSKGVWIPLERARYLAEKTNISDFLYPLLSDDLPEIVKMHELTQRKMINTTPSYTTPYASDNSHKDNIIQRIHTTEYARGPQYEYTHPYTYPQPPQLDPGAAHLQHINPQLQQQLQQQQQQQHVLQQYPPQLHQFYPQLDYQQSPQPTVIFHHLSPNTMNHDHINGTPAHGPGHMNYPNDHNR
ncbi:hypothetical protein TPHA_0I02430 [Tetrapisispora phaffii CBS 4417]|uniref:HTH APSES-type domain-containing protein n=1 Tax=Tetrapisispora phaffii (strain ATCC 24235 / CBS 4417 / NBRC 1672 / NRRL Y-8282 / UCD 70-5) TaxID=1071381 RepID=G8BXW8_TETPH|nr:hypothetical protein TPHA_0I02430 [Tetrapisispora phaffii CBS 4417]CCE64746.1 hypothetical protein TPHA_0I02430 [Tetrapisispora phaffii CBS 4417]